jgi:hypothetical protein
MENEEGKVNIEQLAKTQEQQRGIYIALAAEKVMANIIQKYPTINAKTVLITLQHINMTYLKTIKELWGEEVMEYARDEVRKRIDKYFNKLKEDGEGE